MSETNIEWTAGPNGEKGRVWNPVTGCTKVSQGCKNCYAEGVANRFWQKQYPPVPVSTGADLDATNTFHRPRRFTDVQTHADRLLEPLRWRKTNNVVENLEWLTRAQNNEHARALGLVPALKGEDNGRAKLTSVQVEEIRSLAGTVGQRDIAKRFGVARSLVQRIHQGKAWRA